MKLTATIAVFAPTIGIPTSSAAVCTFADRHSAHLRRTQPPVPMWSLCDVNGVEYPIDHHLHIWDIDHAGNWIQIGQVLATTENRMI